MNRREDAIGALKQSVKLDNPSDWQLLVELTAGGAGSVEGPKSPPSKEASAAPAAAASAEAGEPDRS